MERFAQRVDWHSSEPVVLLNPKLQSTEAGLLLSLAQEYFLPNHIWIASSGTSQSANDSVKLIALSKSALISSAESVNKHLEVEKADIWAQVLPSYHVGGLGIELRAFLNNISVVDGLCKMKWDPYHFQHICELKKVTLSSLVPTQVFDLVQNNLQAPKSIRAILVGGGKFSQELFYRAQTLGWPVLPSFGMTEAGSQIATAKIGQFEMQVLPHLQAVQDSEGLLKIRGSSLLTGYAQVINGKKHFIDPKDRSGWFTTQDRVELSGSILRPEGRISDYIKILGEGVNLNRLQNILEAVVHSMDCVLVATSDARKENKLYLVTDNKNISQSVIDSYNRQVLPYERAEKIIFIEQIPRTDLGKIKISDLQLLLKSYLH